MTDKSLLAQIVEVIDQHRARQRILRQTNETVPPATKRWRSWLPTPGNAVLTLLIFSGLLWAQSVGAIILGVPTASNASTGTVAYQGRLAGTDGTPLTGTYNMIFRLYAASTGGVPLWEEQWTGSNSVQVSDGLFNVMLGSLTLIAQEIITDNPNLFLGITVGTDSEMSPRVQLGSVPFATQALTVPDGSITKAKLDPTISFAPAFEFGGIYVVNPHTGACQSNNPFTSGCSCPVDFHVQVVGEISHGVNGFNCNGVKCYSYMCSK